MIRLKDIIDDFDANGFVLRDAGNGCAGPKWVAWDEDIAEEYGDIEMIDLLLNPSWRNNDDTLVWQQVRNAETFNPVFVSQWIEQENGYRFKVIF